MRINSSASSLIVQSAVEKNMSRSNELTARKSSDFGAVRYSDLGSRISSVVNAKIANATTYAMQQKYNDMHTNIILKSKVIKNISQKLSSMMAEIVRMNQGYVEDGGIIASGKMLKGYLNDVIDQLNTKGSTNKYIFSGSFNNKPIDAVALMKTDFSNFNENNPHYYRGSKEEGKYFIPNHESAPISINANAKGFTDMLSSVAHLVQVMESEQYTKGMPETRGMLNNVYSKLHNVSNTYMPQYINNAGLTEQVFNNFHRNMKKISDVYYDSMLAANDKQKIDLLYKIMSNGESLQTNLELSKKLLHGIKGIMQSLAE